MNIFGDSAKAERKKQLQEFFNLLTIPFVLSIVGSTFYRIAMAALTGQPKDGAVKAVINISEKHFGINFGFSFGIMCLLTYLWGRPAHLYIRKPEEALKEKIRRRLSNIYRDAFIMLVIVQALALVIPALVPGALRKAEWAAVAVSFLAQAALLVVYIDALLSKQKTLMESLYTPEEFFHLRPGFSLPIYVRISTLIAGFALMPFFLIYLLFLNRVSWDYFAADFGVMLMICSIVLLNGLTTIYSGIQLPLNGLIAKMKRVAAGDYVKTRIFFSDEVAHLKEGFNEMVDGLKEREALQDTFGKYLSIEIARELIKNKKVNLGGENMEAAVMFCDIRNFTPLSEKMSASSLVEFLNNYFHFITPPITEHNGVINKFIGDAVMAIYTPMLGSADYAADAVRAAVAMRRALTAYNASGKAPGKVEFGIGIHCGKLVAGNIGTLARLEYTFIGDTVNIASRLESKTRDLNTDIVVSAAAVEKAKGSLGGEIKFEALGKVALKGKSQTLDIYKVA